MLVAIVAFYAGLSGLIAIALAINVARNRIARRVNLGTGDDPLMERAIRAHGNFIENVPLVLLLLLLLALGGVSAWWLHGLGIALLIARLAHAYGLLAAHGGSRSLGITLTWIVLGVASVRAIVLGLAWL
jgi:uncharacterized membrane protein YecN with MAPEG domain